MIHQNVGRIAEILELSSIISLFISKVKIELYENKLQKSFIWKFVYNGHQNCSEGVLVFLNQIDSNLSNLSNFFAVPEPQLHIEWVPIFKHLSNM